MAFTTQASAISLRNVPHARLDDQSLGMISCKNVLTMV